MPGGNNNYEQFLRGLSLVWLGLKSCSAALNREELYKLFDEKGGPNRIFKDSYKITQFGGNFFEACGAFTVRVQESDDSKPVVSVECEFEAHLHGKEPISRACVERFVEQDFRLILIPFARQLVSSTTAQMSIPPLVIPLSVGAATKSTVVSRRKTSARPHAKTR